MENRTRQRRSFDRFRRREPVLPMEKKVEMFILRNSRNGYFTKFSTITTKFNITESETWNVVGMLLSEGSLESVHDLVSGEMKFCEIDKKYEMMSAVRRRKFEKNGSYDGERKEAARIDGRGQRQGGSHVSGSRNGNRRAISNGSGRRSTPRGNGDSNNSWRHTGKNERLGSNAGRSSRNGRKTARGPTSR